jgi:hypothetical protein
MHAEAGLCVCGVQVVLVQEARALPAAKGPSSLHHGLHTFEPRTLLIYVYHTTPLQYFIIFTCFISRL